jgi:hypothetical protein
LAKVLIKGKMKIIKLKHSEIDFEKYDKTLLECKWARVYAMSWYLDIVSPNWELLCDEDYNIVMPLPKTKKFGIPYLIQPMFCQQLGVFAKSEIEKNQIENFYKKLGYYFVIIHGNSFDSMIFSEDKLKPNYFISSKNFEEQQKLFSKNTIRNLKKADSFNHKIITIEIQEYFNFLTKEASNIYNEKLQNALRKIVKKSLDLGYGKLLATTVENEVSSVVFILDFNNRIYYLAPASSQKGKEARSMMFIINDLIKTSIEQGKIFDFEGSSLEGVERFYKSFGASCEYYGIFKKIL